MGDGGTAYRRPSCGLVPRHVLLGPSFFRVGNRKQKPLGGPGTGSTPFLEPIVPRSKRALGPAHSRGAGIRRIAASPGKAGGRVRSRYSKLFRRWRRPTLARASVLPVLGRFPTWSRRRSGRKPGSGQSGGFETRAQFATIPYCRMLELSLVHWNCRSRSFGRGSSCAPLVPRVRASFELDVCSVDRYVYAEDAYCRISFSGLVRALARLHLPPKPPHAFRERPRS